MRASDLSRLLLLAAIWGGSFVFLRVLAPMFGPIVTATLRVSIAWVALALYLRCCGIDMHWRRFWPQYLVIGISNGALPFSLYAFAALHVPASYSAIINATSPIFGALFGWLLLSEAITARKALGIALGIAGVALVTQVRLGAGGVEILWAMLACALAAVCYGFGVVYTKKFAAGADPRAVAGGTQLCAGLLLLPLIPFTPPLGAITLNLILLMIAFAVLSSGVAFLLYFRLIADIGPVGALTVTFLMPAFTMLWAALFLGEAVTLDMVLGCALILAGTGLVVQRG